ncbi:MAG: TatD family hydrolase [Desulfobulbaceae bacterium]|nr:TatD family hydrolase [Desulfobulbaceae bacterium]
MPVNFEIIDTHCHMNAEQFRPDLDDVLDRSMCAGVTDFVIPGYVRSGWDHILEICAKKPCLHPCLGLHPAYCDLHREEDVEELKELSKREQLVAIGEIGLDFQRGHGTEKDQHNLFEQQLSIAKEVHLPVLLHVRKGHDQVLAALRRKRFHNGGIVHAFNGSRQQADYYMMMGFKLGYGGTLTYDRARRIRQLAAELPLTFIVLETDAPDMALAGRRGEINSPEYLPEILDTLASLRPESREEIAAQTSANARQVLGLDHQQ